MTENYYPNAKIHELIMNSFINETELDLEFLDIKVRRNNNHLFHNCCSYEYCFKKKGSFIQFVFSLMEEPELIPLFVIMKNDSNKRIYFDDFLRHIGKEDEVKSIHAKYFFDKDLEVKKKYFYEYLKLVIKYLKTDLKKVISGEEWIDVPNYTMMDYR